MKREAPNKLKFKRLQRALSLPLWQAVGLLETLWHVTACNAPDGDIGKFANDEIAALMEYEGDANKLIEVLVETRWLDWVEPFRLVVHDWSDHVPTYLKGAYKKNGKHFADFAAKQAQEQTNELTKPPAKQPLPNQTKPNQTPPPPSSSKSVAKQVEEKGVDLLSEDEDWDDIETMLRKRGMADAANAVKPARAAGCKPCEIAMLITHWDAYPKAWSIGLLYARIQRFRPGDAPTTGWGDPSPEYKQAQEAKRPPKALGPSLEEQKAEQAAEIAAARAAVEALTDQEFQGLLGESPGGLSRAAKVRAEGKDPRQDGLVQDFVSRAQRQRALARKERAAT